VVAASKKKDAVYHTARALTGKKLVYYTGHDEIPAKNGKPAKPSTRQTHTLEFAKWEPFAEDKEIELGDNATAKVLHVDGKFQKDNPNLNSIVLGLSLGGTIVLLRGDEEGGGRPKPDQLTKFRMPAGKTMLEMFLNTVKAIEAQLLDRHKTELKAHIF